MAERKLSEVQLNRVIDVEDWPKQGEEVKAITSLCLNGVLSEKKKRLESYLETSCLCYMLNVFIWSNLMLEHFDACYSIFLISVICIR